MASQMRRRISLGRSCRYTGRDAGGGEGPRMVVWAVEAGEVRKQEVRTVR